MKRSAKMYGVCMTSEELEFKMEGRDNWILDRFI